MTRKILIEVNISDEIESANANWRGGNVWYISVGKEYNQAIAFAHELGHVIANEFRFPKAMGDPRGVGFPGVVGDPDFRWGIFNAEVEAWDIAEIILARRQALETYETGLQLKEEWYAPRQEVQNVR